MLNYIYLVHNGMDYEDRSIEAVYDNQKDARKHAAMINGGIDTFPINELDLRTVPSNYYSYAVLFEQHREPYVNTTRELKSCLRKDTRLLSNGKTMVYVIAKDYQHAIKIAKARIKNE